MAGQIPALIPDTSAQAVASKLPSTLARRVAAFMGVVLRRSDGSVFGTLCCASHAPEDGFQDRDLRFLAMLAELVVPELDERVRRDKLRADIQRLIDTEAAVEMTENSVVESYETLRTKLDPLRERGLRVCIDDTGAGYASLRHVVELRPDLIKIDRSLIEGVSDNHARRVAVRALVEVARDLDALVVAEEVERAADFRVLADMGSTLPRATTWPGRPRTCRSCPAGSRPTRAAASEARSRPRRA